MCVLEAGAHMDTVNAAGKTPIEVARTGNSEFLLPIYVGWLPLYALNVTFLFRARCCGNHSKDPT